MECVIHPYIARLEELYDIINDMISSEGIAYLLAEGIIFSLGTFVIFIDYVRLSAGPMEHGIQY